MVIIAKVRTALQGLFGKIAEVAAQTSDVIVRKRKFDGMSLSRTFVLGYLQNPKASDEDLAQIAVQCGVQVTPQAIDQRHSPKLVEFLKTLFHGATKVVVASDKALARMALSRPKLFYVHCLRNSARSVCRDFCMSL